MKLPGAQDGCMDKKARDAEWARRAVKALLRRSLLMAAHELTLLARGVK